MSNPFGTPPRQTTTTQPLPSISSPHRDDDDTDLLDLLLIHSSPDADEQHDVYDRLQRMQSRLDSDISTTGSNSWWDDLLSRLDGFAVDISSSTTITTFSSNSGGDNTNVPSAFQSPRGKLHLRALMDTCDISSERGVQLTFGTLTSLLSSSTLNNYYTNDNDGNDDVLDDGGEDEEERANTLLSQLGTRSLFDKCTSRYRFQFLTRVRILLECLRVDQEGRAASDSDNVEGGDGGAIGEEVSKFLSAIDSRTVINGHKRGLFHFLLQLATGPLPEVFSVASVAYSAQQLSGPGAGYDTEEELIALNIRKEAVESLLVLMYDRLEGGVNRVDLMMLLESSSSVSASLVQSDGSGSNSHYGNVKTTGLECLEFGMTSSHYIQNGGLHRKSSRRNRGDDSILTSRESVLQSVEKMRLSLNGLWSLLYAECMGLWRTNAENKDWRIDHPLFAGLTTTATPRLPMEGNVNTPNTGLTGRDIGLTLHETTEKTVQKELGLLYRKLLSVGEALRDRRRVAYKHHKGISKDGDEIDYHDDDDELWGVQAPEGVALLSFGLLLQMARFGDDNSGGEDFVVQLSKWGQECTRMANDDCAAFAYLERVLDGVVVDPLDRLRDRLSTRLGAGHGEGARIVKVLAGRKEITMLADVESMALMDEDGVVEDEEDSEDFVEGLAVDASSVVYSSIGREILSATIRVFKTSLLSLQSSSAVDNIGMLVDLAAIIYRHSTPLCDQFWSDWNEFSTAMTDEGATPSSSDESMCFLLETAHNLAQSTINELANGGRREAIIKYLRPMSSFLRLIASLCPSSPVVHNVLDSGFLPDGLLSQTLSICYALAPMASSLNESIEPVTSDERRTIQHATAALDSIARIAYLGGNPTRDWLRSTLANTKQPRILIYIASKAMPRRNGAVAQECSDLASSALNLLSELLVGAATTFHVETAECFAPSNTFASRAENALSYFFRGGIHSRLTLSALSVLGNLAVNLNRNAFDENTSPRSICTCIEMLHDGVKAGLDILSCLFSNGQVAHFALQTELDAAYSIMLSTVATLMACRAVMHLHKDNNVLLTSLSVREDIVGTVSSSTALGQVIAHLSTAPIILFKASFLREFTHHLEPPVAQDTSIDSKYGEWGKFVTPKRRASQKVLQGTEKAINDEKGIPVLGEEASALSSVAEVALSLFLVWASQVEDMFCNSSGEIDESFTSYSPYNLLLSKVPSTSRSGTQMNVSNLNVIFRYNNIGKESQLSKLSAKVIRVCIQHTSHAAQVSGGDQIAQTGILSAFAGSAPLLSQSVLASLEELFGKVDFVVGMEQTTAIVSSNLESIALTVSKQPELARCILSQKKGKEFKLADELVSAVDSTVSILNTLNQKKTHDSRVLKLRCAVATGCLDVMLELWKCCRLGALNRTECHACGDIVSHLLSEDGSHPMIANVVAELARSSLFAIVSQDDKESMDGLVPVSSVNDKSLFLGLLSRCLRILTIETVALMQTDRDKSLNFIAELIDPNPVECFISLLRDNKSPTLASSAWVDAKVTPSVDAFLRACPSETSPYACSLDLAIQQAQVFSKEDGILRWNALHNLAINETAYSSEFALFFKAVGLSSSRPAMDVLVLTNSLIDGILAAMSSISEAKLSSQSILPGFVTKVAAPFNELSSLLLSVFTTRARLQKTDGESLLQMLHKLHESASRIFILTQSVSDNVMEVRRQDASFIFSLKT